LEVRRLGAELNKLSAHWVSSTQRLEQQVQELNITVLEQEEAARVTNTYIQDEFKKSMPASIVTAMSCGSSNIRRSC
jgi:hypothetical protein